GLLHLAGRMTGTATTGTRQVRVRAAVKVLSGFVLGALSLLVLWLVLPFARWVAVLADLRTPYRLVVPALANATVLAAAYSAIAALVGAVPAAAIPHPRELPSFRSRRDFVRSWRVAHLSDIHVVGERYGFRLGSGRAGPRGNGNFVEALRRLDALHRREPLDA